MATVAETIKANWPKRTEREAIIKLGKCADVFRSHGFNYKAVLKAFRKAIGEEISEGDFEQVMYEADSIDTSTDGAA